MPEDAVAFSSSLRCPSCGLQTSGYLKVSEGNKGVAICSRCGASIVQDINPGQIRQIPPQPYFAHSGADHKKSKYEGLYSQPKHAPRFAWVEMLRLPVSPRRALTTLYLSTDMRHAMILVALLTTMSIAFSTVITEEMAAVVGIDHLDALEMLFIGAVGWVVTLVSFLIFSIVSAIVAQEMFEGRGDKGATVTLVGYCFPWFVVVSIVLLSIFTAGFSGLELDRVQDWTDSEIERALTWGALLLVSAVLAVIWLLFLVGRAIGVANDISTAGGSLSAVIGAIAAGLVSLIVGMVLRLPIGISF